MTHKLTRRLILCFSLVLLLFAILFVLGVDLLSPIQTFFSF